MKIKILTLLLIVSATVIVTAQNVTTDSVINRSVTVERDFQPVIKDAGKIIAMPKEIEPEIEKSKPAYADFTTPVKVKYTVKALDPEILVHQPHDAKNGFLRLGIGYPLNTLGDFMYPLLKNKNNRLDFSLNHLGAFSDFKHSKTTASLQYDHIFDNFSIFAGVKGSHDFFNYYGRWFGNDTTFILADAAQKFPNAIYNSPDNSEISLYNLSGMAMDETHWRLKTHVGAKSLPQSYGVKYLFDVEYNIFKSVKEVMNENQIALNGIFEVPFDDNFLGMNLNINNISYDINSNLSFPKTYSVLKFNPYYKITGDVGYLKLGVKTGISSNFGQTFTPSPDVEVQWNAIREYLALYGGITGDLQINTMNKMYDENRYLSSPIRINDTYTPIDAFAGIKFKPAYNFLIDIFGNYKIIDNQYFFVNREYKIYQAVTGLPNKLSNIFQNRFDIMYANTIQKTVGMRADYHYKNVFNLYLKGAYNVWDVNDQQYAWQLPNWDVNFGSSANITHELNVSTQIFFQNGRYAKLGTNAVKMTPTLDLNLGASYTYSNWLSFFAKANNLLNRHYDYYYGYEVQGINAMIGAAISF